MLHEKEYEEEEEEEVAAEVADRRSMIQEGGIGPCRSE